jgi:hypothetical protein
MVTSAFLGLLHMVSMIGMSPPIAGDVTKQTVFNLVQLAGAACLLQE